MASASENANVARFNREAAGWDSNPFTVRCSELALSAILGIVPDLRNDEASNLVEGITPFASFTSENVSYHKNNISVILSSRSYYHLRA